MSLCFSVLLLLRSFFFFFFNDTATTEIYTLSLHDALPISGVVNGVCTTLDLTVTDTSVTGGEPGIAVINKDRKSTRLNSSHQIISYAVFCLKKKKNITQNATLTSKKRHILHLHPRRRTCAR